MERKLGNGKKIKPALDMETSGLWQGTTQATGKIGQNPVYYMSDYMSDQLTDYTAKNS